MNIHEYSQEEAQELDMSEFSLWWGDFEGAGIDCCYIAIEDGSPIGFQSVNGDGRCVAIEVIDEFKGKGVSTKLIDKSGSWKPEQNEFPEFWDKMKDIYG